MTALIRAIKCESAACQAEGSRNDKCSRNQIQIRGRNRKDLFAVWAARKCRRSGLPKPDDYFVLTMYGNESKSKLS
jgi:hypothetical protein